MKNFILTFIILFIKICPLEAEPLEAKIQMTNKGPKLYVNNERYLPIMTFVNTGILESYDVSERQVRYAAEYGNVHLHQVNFALPMNEKSEYDFTAMKSSLDLLRRADPKGFAFIRIHLNDNCNSAGGYSDDDRVRYSNGNIEKEISIASDKWIENAANKIEAIADFCERNPKYGNMIAGYFPAAGETGEWFQWKYREFGVDISYANTKKFRQWLERRYNNNVNLLQASWHNENVNFKNAQIPYDELGSEKVNSQERILYNKPSDQRVIDYLDYYNDMTTDRMIFLAKLIKQKTKNKVLVGFFYGYLFDLWEAKSGHYNLEKILDTPEIDFLAAPISYRSRNEGEIGGSMSLVESVQAHGKIWFDECDYRSPIKSAEGNDFADFTPKVKTMEGLRQIYRRQIGFQMIRGSGCWPMDLMGMGWYDDIDFWKELKSLNELYSKYEPFRPSSSPEVALVLDEKGLTLAADSRFNMWMLERLRDELYCAGVNFGIYQRKDIERGYASDAKLYIMVGAFRLDSDMVNNLSRVLHQKGKTTVWLYSLGVTSDPDKKKLLSGENGSKQFIYHSNIIKADSIRSLAITSGAHVFISGGYDACMANKNLIVLHTAEGGTRNINFPGKVDVYEQFSGKWYYDVNTISLNVHPATTYMFFYGSKKVLQNVGIGIPTKNKGM